MNPTTAVGALVLAVLVILLIWTEARRRTPRAPAPASAPTPDAALPTCPLCGSSLARGERVRSTVFASKTPDKIMEISGCPHCGPEAGVPRFCPVCKKLLKKGEVVTARVFERPQETGAKKTHVHVLGCPRCRS